MAHKVSWCVPMASAIFKWSEMTRSEGFTLLEVLVALVIIGTALAASLRAIGSLTQNSSDLRAAMMATCGSSCPPVSIASAWRPC